MTVDVIALAATMSVEHRRFVSPHDLCTTCGMPSRPHRYPHPITTLMEAQKAASTPQWVDVKAVAAALNVSKMTVYRLVHDEDLPASRIGRSIRVRADHLAEYMRRASMHATDEQASA